jgi:ribonuclease HI
VRRYHPEPEVLVYADGSCLGNPGPGGWGVVIVGRDGTREYSGSDPQTTNNRMELTAAIEGLRRLPAGARVLLRSDSQYLVNSINFGWKRNANVDLWKDLDVEIARRRVRFEWVKGHAGDQLNDRADRLALEAAKVAADAGRTLNKPAPAQLSLPEQATLNALRPLLKEGEVVRRCACCGGRFVGTDSDPSPYCALTACQLERRTRPG